MFYSFGENKKIMAKYRKKPVIIDAIQWNGKSLADAIDIRNELNPEFRVAVNGKGQILIETLEGQMAGDVGDFIIKGVNNELYPCKADIFEKTYDKL